MWDVFSPTSQTCAITIPSRKSYLPFKPTSTCFGETGKLRWANSVCLGDCFRGVTKHSVRDEVESREHFQNGIYTHISYYFIAFGFKLSYSLSRSLYISSALASPLASLRTMVKSPLTICLDRPFFFYFASALILL